ncbi:hypothetical protein [Fluviicola taffensis]|uniref:Lipoprotein n=1 Tax=Fluviicola taffensis (strain DSM 16823 / NCIMB 13979 / RW262) TaxID=755732 RepID=F2IIK7_FLUTR|nr:hypothetical protein [Fluviicola taffensis]AEA45969.1 hypothetical protein Fluta_4007 [Fluviicola taffensis DSM 16823]
MKSFSIGLICLLFIVSSCDEETTSTTENSETTTSHNESFDARAKREIVAALGIPTNEKYSIRIYKEFISSDTIKDAIITVNRMEYAINESIRNQREAKAAETGYTGNYNYIFYYDGELDKISSPIFAPSSPGRELDVEFKSIVSPARKDLILGYRIRNSGWKCYFSVFNDHDFRMIFQWKSFDFAGEDNPEVLFHSYETNPSQVPKDIAIYTSEIDSYTKNIGDIYQYVPSITKKKELKLKFFLDLSAKKYRLYPEFAKNLPKKI